MPLAGASAGNRQECGQRQLAWNIHYSCKPAFFVVCLARIDNAPAGRCLQHELVPAHYLFRGACSVRKSLCIEKKCLCPRLEILTLKSVVDSRTHVIDIHNIVSSIQCSLTLLLNYSLINSELSQLLSHLY